jgi:hypothetical protein
MVNNLLVMTDASAFGLIRGKRRKRIKQLYKAAKRGLLTTRLTYVIMYELVMYIKEKYTNTDAMYDYLYCPLYLPLPALSLILRLVGKVNKIQRVKSLIYSLYDVTTVLMNGGFKVLDCVMLPLDFILFGEYVSTFGWINVMNYEYLVLANLEEPSLTSDLTEFLFKE